MPIVEPSLPPEATHLSQSDACIGDDGTRELCARLAHHANLTSLDLRGCQIHAAGAAAIAALLLHQVRAWGRAGCSVPVRALGEDRVEESGCPGQGHDAGLAFSRFLTACLYEMRPNRARACSCCTRAGRRL